MKITKPEIISIILMLAPIIIWMNGFFSTGKMIFWLDPAFIFYPLTATGMEQLRSGIIPLWLNSIQCGFPLIGEGQGAIFYPFNLLTFLFLPSPIAQNMSIVLQVIFSSLLMYMFIRSLGIGRWPAVVAGWIWIFGPVATSMGACALNELVWWPLLFLLARSLAYVPSWRIVGAGGAVMGICWLGGYPQTNFLGILGASMYLLFLTFVRKEFSWRPALLSLAAWAIAGGIGIGVGAIQILPTLEMSAQSVRANGIDFTFAMQGSMVPTGFASFFMPQFIVLQKYWLAGIPNLFIGFICLAFVLVTLGRGKDKRAYFFWLLLGIACLLSIGKFNPFSLLTYQLPGFNSFRTPSKFLYLALFSLSVLAALGLEKYFSLRIISVKENRTLSSRLMILLGIGFFLSVGGSVIWLWGRPFFKKVAEEYTYRFVMGIQYKMQNREFYKERIANLMADVPKAISPFQVEFLGSFIIGLIAVVIIFMWRRNQKVTGNAKVALIILIAANFWLLANGPIELTSTRHLAPPPLAKYLAAEKGLFRIYNVNRQSDVIRSEMLFDRLDPDYNMLFNIAHVGYYGALGSFRYFQLLGTLGSVNLGFGMPPVNDQNLINNLPLLNLLNVRYVVCNDSINVPSLTLEQSGRPFLYRNNGELPRAFVVPAATVMRSAPAMLDSMHSSRFDPWDRVFIETQPAYEVINGVKSAPQMVRYSDQYISMNAEGPGWLVLTDLYYKGWKAFIDDRPAVLYRGNYVFRTLPLAAGSHKVEFRFVSDSFRRGVIITGLSLLLSLILIGTGKGSFETLT